MVPVNRVYFVFSTNEPMWLYTSTAIFRALRWTPEEGLGVQERDSRSWTEVKFASKESPVSGDFLLANLT